MWVKIVGTLSAPMSAVELNRSWGLSGKLAYRKPHEPASAGFFRIRTCEALDGYGVWSLSLIHIFHAPTSVKRGYFLISIRQPVSAVR